MTETTDPVRALVDALAPGARSVLRAALNDPSVVADIHAASGTHTPDELAALITVGLAGLANQQALMKWRLRRYAGRGQDPAA